MNVSQARAVIPGGTEGLCKGLPVPEKGLQSAGGAGNHWHQQWLS